MHSFKKPCNFNFLNSKKIKIMYTFFSFLAIARIKYPTGEINYIPKLESKYLQNFINENPKTILFFTKNPDECSFANFAISYFTKYIKFALAPEGEGYLYHCKSYPCIIPFSNGKHVQYARPAPHQQTLFSHWCAENLNPSKIEITNAEYLRSILMNNNGFFVISIDISEKPNYIPSEMPFYYCSSKIFHQLDINNVSKGVYVYRGADHLLDPVENDNILDLLNSKITSYDDININNKDFTAGFDFNSDDKYCSEKKISLLLNLSKTFKDNFYFTRFDNNIIYNSKLQFAEKPLFLVFNNSQPQITSNWILTGDDALQYDTIVDFLTKIKKGTLNYTRRSKFDQISIEVDHFDELVFNSNENDTILLIVDNFSQYIEAKTAIESVLFHLSCKTIDFFILNATINDMPNMVNPKKLPSLLIFRGGKNKRENPPILFHGDFLFQEIIGFLQQTTVSKFEIRPYDSRQKDEEIKKMRNELKRKLN